MLTKKEQLIYESSCLVLYSGLSVSSCEVVLKIQEHTLKFSVDEAFCDQNTGRVYLANSQYACTWECDGKQERMIFSRILILYLYYEYRDCVKLPYDLCGISYQQIGEIDRRIGVSLFSSVLFPGAMLEMIFDENEVIPAMYLDRGTPKLLGFVNIYTSRERIPVTYRTRATGWHAVTDEFSVVDIARDVRISHWMRISGLSYQMFTQWVRESLEKLNLGDA